MSLPYPSLTFVPFDILTAAELNNMHANSVALAAGTGLDNGAVTNSKIADSTISGDKTNQSTYGYSRAYMAATQSLPHNTYTKVAYNTEEADILSEYDTTQYRYTASKTGRYLIAARFLLSASTTGDLRLQIRVNGTNAGEVINDDLGDFENVQFSDVLGLTAGDYVEVFAFQNSGVTKTLSAGTMNTKFTVTRVI